MPDTSILQVADACAFAIKWKLMKKSDGDYYFGPITSLITSFNGVGTAVAADALKVSLAEAPAKVSENALH
jgi:hypothetical protein